MKIITYIKNLFHPVKQEPVKPEKQISGKINIPNVIKKENGKYAFSWNGIEINYRFKRSYGISKSLEFDTQNEIDEYKDYYIQFAIKRFEDPNYYVPRNEWDDKVFVACDIEDGIEEIDEYHMNKEENDKAYEKCLTYIGKCYKTNTGNYIKITGVDSIYKNTNDFIMDKLSFTHYNNSLEIDYIKDSSDIIEDDDIKTEITEREFEEKVNNFIKLYEEH